MKNPIKALIQKNQQQGEGEITLGLWATGLTASTLSHGPLVWMSGIPTLVMPRSWKSTKALLKASEAITNSWLSINNQMIDTLLPNLTWTIDVPEGLSEEGQYLITCNHQTWIDTTVYQYLNPGRLPMGRFFTKYELIYIPFVGQAFKFLGFPMMKRHPREAIAKNPKLAQVDAFEAKRSCERMKDGPYALLNYIEGTRLNEQKHKLQKSPYRHLLKPKYTGLALAFNALEGSIDELLDMTIIYPDGIPTYLDFWRGKVKRISVKIRKIPVPEWVGSAEFTLDENYKIKFKAWVDELWLEKDELIETMRQELGVTGHKIL